MNEAQKNAIDTNMVALCGAIESDLFLSYMRIRQLLKRNECELISKEITNEAKVLKTFDILTSKEGGWEATIEFLDVNGLCPKTVEQLRSLGGYSVTHSEVNLQAELEQTRLSPESSNWRQFIRDVNDFYLGDYRVVESFDVDGDSDLIESVWVDLQLEGSREPIGHYGEIFAQMRAKNCRLAIVRGQPGSGKTTLAKKIAYDWANKQKRTGLRKLFSFQPNRNSFDLVLAVPLRGVHTNADLMKLAVGKFIGYNNVATVQQICTDLRRQNLKILIILDGLDEYLIPPNSPLSCIFAPAVNNVDSTGPTKFDFDLIITSRPFACHLTHVNIAAVKYKIGGFATDKQIELVTKRCKNREGKRKAIEYLNHSNSLREIAHNPFLLTLICFLSDHNELIPATLTKLYVTFIHRMLVRSARKNSVGNIFDPSNWQQSELLKNLGSLALFGVIKNQFQFNQEEMQMSHVTKEYFNSGLLQYRSDPVGLVLKCDFPHRSIQDFLAAFYAVHYWGDKTLTEATGWPMDIWQAEIVDLFPQMKVELLMARVIRSDSQFCRFFFGLNSGKKDFSCQYRLAVEGIFAICTPFLLHPIWFLLIGRDLTDCSAAENFAAGQIANDMADLIGYQRYLHPNLLEEETFKFANGGGSREALRSFTTASLVEELSDNFCLGLKLCQIHNRSASFSVGTDDPQRLNILCLFMDDKYIRQNIGHLLNFSHVGCLRVYMISPLQEHNVAILQVLTQITSLNNLEIASYSQSDFVNLIVTVESQQPTSPSCFSLKYLRIRVSPDCGKKLLQKFQSASDFLPKKIRILSVKKWQSFDNFSVTIVAENDISNFDIWNAIQSV